MASESPPPSNRGDRDRERSPLEGVLPELLKRIIEAGVERLSPEHVRQVAREMKLPKEALAFALAQMDESKHGLYRVVAKELRDFLEHTNFAEELAKALTLLTFEIKMEVRFVPNEGKSGTRPDVRTNVRMKRGGPKGDAEPEATASEEQDRGD